MATQTISDNSPRSPNDSLESSKTGAPYLEIRDLRTAFPGNEKPTVVVNDVSLSLARGETLAVVGESGSGKTMTFLSALGLLPKSGRVIGGEARLSGQDLLKLPPRELRALRGSEIAMVFQDPLSGLNPVFRIGEQIIEAIRAHRRISRREARLEAIRLLERVHIPAASSRIDDYPHQLSGGMRQRALIAMAIALDPAVLIADEPTTALDVTVQAQILELLAGIQSETGMGMVLITHDLGLVARHADRVAVMYGGRVVEQGRLGDVFKRTRHPYTVSLFRSIPHLHTPADAELTPIEGQPPNPAELPPGCAFEARCYLGKGRSDCANSIPALAATDLSTHLTACHHWQELAGPGGNE
ncbi:MAG: ABC transporter ATP-binding protein [Hyphomicrobiaceae bacterium]